MTNEFTAIIERDEEWYIGYCLEVPGANGQGRTVDECRASLAAAIALVKEDVVSAVGCLKFGCSPEGATENSQG